MTLIKLLKTLATAQGNNNMEEKNNNAQLCKNEKEITLNILINRFLNNPEKEENRLIEYVKNNSVIEFYDIYP